MTEGQGMAAAAARRGSADAAVPPAQFPPQGTAAASAPARHAAAAASAAAASAAPAAPARTGASGQAAPAAAGSPAPVAGGVAARQAPGGRAPGTPAGEGRGQEAPEAVQDVLVNARNLETALLALRQPIMDAPLPLEIPGVAEARAERRKLLAQIDDYLLPRLRETGSPVLVALVGSTGAGKSTLVNSIVGAQVSNTGVRRPTTNSPVLACHPDDVGWFAENVFLPTVPRVRQEGLARPGRDGLLVLAASEGMPRGLALLDTPDIDSVVEAHREFAHQFLDASDLWLFMTTANRYADAAVWELLQHARDRGAALGLVLSRVPPAAQDQLVEHFAAMLDANGLGGNERFVINETVLQDGKLPPEVSGPVRKWLEETAAQGGRRVAVLTQTMSGVLDTFRTRIPALAGHVEAQFAARQQLGSAAQDAYAAALGEVRRSLRDGSLLRGEIWARWQDFAGSGDLLRTLQARRGGRQRRQQPATRVQVLKLALRAGIESLIGSAAGRAAEDCLSRWRQTPAGAALVDGAPRAAALDGWSGSPPASLPDAGVPWDVAGAGQAGGAGKQAAALGRASASLAPRAARAVSAWQDFLIRLVRVENLAKRSIARAVTFDDETLSTVLAVGVLGQDAAEGQEGEGSGALALRVLGSLFGTGPLRDITARARADLEDRARLLLDEEMLRFLEVLDRPGVPDATAALRLYQATYTLEVTR